ncbi:hypothetical protein DN748_01525 [Sinomicrobium soli]|nr:hypothetical protein DN748_01525 [Sinomicrobium sp. N-1-3-6]
MGTDYTIDEKSSILLNVHWEQRNAERDVDFKSEQSLYGQPEKTYTDKNFFRSGNSAYGIDLGYRYDIEKNKTRLDIAGSYGRGQTDDNDRYTGETTEPGQDSGTRNTSRNERNEEHFYVSARTDYSTKFGDLDQYNYEMGVKFDHVFLHNMNTFEHFDPAMQLFETDPALSTDFDYRENTYAGYASISSSGGRLKYSAGIRLEHTRTSSHVKTEQQQQVNSFFNIMPVASVKYMIDKRQTSNINLSYRKGYSLPPYMQLNPFENYVNSNTLRRGNPDLEQSIFHLISLGVTLKNRYFLTWSSNYYTDVIEVAETMEDETNIIS